ncbi:hypothetical protein EOM09_02735 [bacterium]|nr:hypothetical protein [bacterium]
MKKLGIMMVVLGLSFIIVDIILAIKSEYQYENEIQSYWNLADKSSTIEIKSKYINKFVIALENSNLQGKHSAIIFKTPDNSFDNNLTALKTLQTRLHEIQKMDINSFEYQIAIQQITEQEQGEAYQMLNVFQETWNKEHYFLIWSWIGAINAIACIIMIIFGAIIWIKNNY